MNASGGGISSDLTLFLRVWKMKCKHPLSCGTQLFTTHHFFFLPFSPLQNIFIVFSVFLPWEQRACLVCVEWGCWEYGKGTQCVAQVCLILLSKERLEGWGTSLLVLSLPLSVFFLSPSKKGTGCWMLTYHNVGQSTHKKKKKRRRMGGVGGGGLG